WDQIGAVNVTVRSAVPRSIRITLGFALFLVVLTQRGRDLRGLLGRRLGLGLLGLLPGLLGTGLGTFALLLPVPVPVAVSIAVRAAAALLGGGGAEDLIGVDEHAAALAVVARLRERLDEALAD